MIGHDELGTHPDFATAAARVARRDQANRLVAEWCADKSLAGVIASCAKAGIPAGPVRTYAEAARDSHVRERDMLQDVAQEDGKVAPLTGPAAKFSRTRRACATAAHSQAGRAAKGKPIVNLINVNPDTRVESLVPVREFSDTQFLLFCTRKGTVKKSALSQYSNVRNTGIKAIKIEPGDALIDVQVTSGSNDIVLATKHGLSVRFHEQDVREMGRDTTGVKGIELRADDSLVGMVVIKRDATILVVTEKGLGKCSHIDDYRVQRRGGKGIITVNRTEKTGDVVGVMEVLPEDEIMLITRNGVIIRSSVAQIRVTGRIAQGVRLVNLDDGDVLTAVARVVPEEDGDPTGDDSALPDSPEGEVEVSADEE